MLLENKQNYENYADSFLKYNWRKDNKNNLFRKYIENEKNIPIRDAYFSAIIYRYWNKLYKYYNLSYTSATPEDVYYWIINAAQYTLKKRMWENPKSSIYNDPNGPDKVMNRMIKSFRLGHYEKTNTDKRRLNINTLSTDYLLESLGDSSLPIIEDRDLSLLEDPVKDIIKEFFAKKDYFTSFMIFNIVFQDVFISDNKGKIKKLNPKKLNYCMRHIDENICDIFSKNTHIKLEDVKSAAKTCNCLSNNKVSYGIRTKLKYLSKLKYLKEGNIKYAI